MYQEPPPRDRRFSSVAKAFLSPRTRSESRLPIQSANITTNPFPREYKGLEPLAPVHSREARDSEDASPLDTPASPFSMPISPLPPYTPPCITPTPTSTGLDRLGSDRGPLRKMPSRFDRIHWKYAKFAFLCTIVLLITWVCCLRFPSTTASWSGPNHLLTGHRYPSALIEYTTRLSPQITKYMDSTSRPQPASHCTALAILSSTQRPVGPNVENF